MSKKFKQCRYLSLNHDKWDESWLPLELAVVGKYINFGTGITFKVVQVGTRIRTSEEMHKLRNERRNSMPSIDVKD